MLGRIVVRFGVSASLAANASIVAMVVAMIAGVSLAGGDQRSGVFPVLMAIAAACLVLCALGVLTCHRPDPRRSVVIGGLWVAGCLGAISAAFAAIGVGDLLGIEEDSAGTLAWIPVSAMGFAVLTFPAALGILGFGTQRSGVLPRWGTAAIWALVPLVPITMILAGIIEGQAENWVPGVMLSIIVVLLGIVGQSLRVASRGPSLS